MNKLLKQLAIICKHRAKRQNACLRLTQNYTLKLQSSFFSPQTSDAVPYLTYDFPPSLSTGRGENMQIHRWPLAALSGGLPGRESTQEPWGSMT